MLSQTPVRTATRRRERACGVQIEPSRKKAKKKKKKKLLTNARAAAAWEECCPGPRGRPAARRTRRGALGHRHDRCRNRGKRKVRRGRPRRGGRGEAPRTWVACCLFFFFFFLFFFFFFLFLLIFFFFLRFVLSGPFFVCVQTRFPLPIFHRHHLHAHLSDRSGICKTRRS
jgi:hypothetical protein